MPKELTTDEVKDLVQAFADSVKRAVDAGFDTIELHTAHGYLIHQFYSPKSNQRTDEYGQDKALFGVEVIKAAKKVMPTDMPLIVRISAQEYGKDGFDSDYGMEIAKRFSDAGADIFDVSGVAMVYSLRAITLNFMQVIKWIWLAKSNKPQANL